MKILVGIISVVLTVLSFCDETEEGKVKSAKGSLQAIGSSIEIYKQIGESYPSTKQGIRALVKKPNEAPRPRRWVQSLRKVPLDPWGREFEYKRVKGHFKLWSKGADLKSDKDDIIYVDPKKWRKGR